MPSSSTWARPRTNTAAFARATEIAKRLDLQIEVANTVGAAQRHGNFWIIDRSLAKRAGQAETLEQVLDILTRYERERPDGRPQPQPWTARLLRWRPW